MAATKITSLTRHTTIRREWWGWVGSISWLFFMMYGYDTFYSGYTFAGYGGTWHPYLFMLVLALAITVFSRWFGRDPAGLSGIAFYTTPVAIVLTALFALMPYPFSTALYLTSPVLMAPAISRRVYGVLQTAKPNRRLTRYMSGVCLCVVAFTVWMMIEPPAEIAFIIPALLAVPAWTGLRHSVSLPDDLPVKSNLRLSKKLIVLLAAAIVLLIWLDVLLALIHTFIMTYGNETSEVLYLILGLVLPPVAFLLYGILSDKGLERRGVMCGMGLLIVGITLSFLSDSLQGAILLPLAISEGLGGAYTEYFILTIPVLFLVGSKRPVFAASLGIIANLISSALIWEVQLWIPEIFMSLDAPLLTSALLTAFILLIMMWFLLERYRDNTIAAALYSMLYGGADGVTINSGGTAAGESADAQNLLETMFTSAEQDVVLLLIDGKTRSEITRKLQLGAAEANDLMKAIREKTHRMGNTDPVVANIVRDYNLTRREADMLNGLYKSKTNSEIADELVLSEETVKIHVRNLLKKLPVDGRQDVTTWVDSLREKT